MPNQREQELIENQRAEARKAILEYYNENQGMVITAIRHEQERAKRAQEEAARFENNRMLSFMLCHDLLHELWELEKTGIIMLDDKATYGSILPAEEGAEAYSLITSTGDILTIYTSKTQPCRVTWTAERQVIREAVIMDKTGVCLSDYDATIAFMDIASEFMNAFIANNNVGR